jgi:hypothetical protein
MDGIAIDGPLEGETFSGNGYSPGSLFDRAQDPDDPDKLHIYRVNDDTDGAGRNHLSYRWSIARTGGHAVIGEALDGPVAGDWVDVVRGLRKGERTPIKRPGGTLIYEATGEQIADDAGKGTRIALRFVGETV